MVNKKKQVQKQLQKGRNKILIILGLIGLAFIACRLQADEIVHKFKSPSFNGQNTSQHYLTVESQEYSRKEQFRKDLAALAEQKKRDEDNSVISRFQRNLESRIFAQISRQIVDNLFGEDPSSSGIFTIFGNTIEYTSDGEFITLKITDEFGNVTEITIPIGDLTF